MENIMRKTFYLLMLVFICTNLKAQWKPGDNIIDSRDGQIYKTVQVGYQVWMAENLNFGNIIPTTKAGAEMSDNGIVEKYCWDNDVANCDGSGGKMKRGGFYEWNEAMQFWTGQPQLPVRGICPEGWHIPSNTEWNEYFAFIGNSPQKMLDGGESGFDALLTGYRCTMTGSFRVSAMSSDTRTYFWTAEQTDIDNAPILELGAGSLQSFSFLKSVGLCIRCLWDGESSDVEEIKTFGSLNIGVSPNPFDTETTITVLVNGNTNEKIRIDVYDLLGNIVVSFNDGILRNGKHEFKIQSSDFPSGVYYVVASSINQIVKAPIYLLR